MAILATKGGELSLPSKGRRTLAAFLFSIHPKREWDRQAHLNYYSSAYNSWRQLSHRKMKLNHIQQKVLLGRKYTLAASRAALSESR